MVLLRMLPMAVPVKSRYAPLLFVLLQLVECSYQQSKKAAKPPTAADIAGKCNDVVSLY